MTLSIYIGLIFPIHAFYVSITDVEYQAENKSLKVQVKIFSNDLEDDIRNLSGEVINLQDGVNTQESLRVDNYLFQRMKLLIDGKPPELRLTSCKVEGDAVFSIYEGELRKEPKDLEISSHILLELFPTQSNIVRLKNGTWKGLVKLNKQQTKGSLSF